MGLGKTPIAIACAEQLLACGDIDLALVVCPASLKYQWAQQITKFTDLPSVPFPVKGETIRIPSPYHCVIIDGPPEKRKLQYHALLAKRPPYVILSYENVLNDSRFVRRINPGLTVLDECSAIKTFQAKRTKRVKQILASEYRLGLTGTPVENRPEELYSIMQWVDEDALGRYDLFERAYINRDRYGRVRSYKNLPVLRKRIAPAISRKSRLDPDVVPYLPEVDTGEWYVRMDTALREAYLDIATDLYKELKALPASSSFDLHAYYSGTQSYSESSALGRVMARQVALEMLLDHPSLLALSEAEYCKSKASIQYTVPPKISLLKDKVAEILEFDPRNKILIFTRFRKMLSLLEKELPGRSVLFHGGMNAAEKAAAIAEFSASSTTRLFLSSHAGAYGNDMHMANYLINYDLPWSSGKADQINGRHVRVSSGFSSVFVRNLVVSGTIEERRLALLDFKRSVAGAILDGRGAAADGTITNDLQSLMNHLTAVLAAR